MRRADQPGRLSTGGRRLIGGVAVLVLALAATVAAASPFGVNAHTPDATVLDEVVASGADWIRIDFLWSAVEPRRDRFDWSLYDRLVDEATARGLAIFATIASTPAWATAGEPDRGVPSDPADFYDLCFSAAERYRGRIRAWGLWNEPNLSKFWQGSRGEYLERILVPGASAIRSADPDALVCAPTVSHSDDDWDAWLRATVTAAGPLLDVVTLNLYPSGAGASEVSDDLERGGSWPWGETSVKEALRDAGWEGRPFWLAETGLDSYQHGEFAQADFYTNLLDDWFDPGSVGDWVGRIFFYEMADDPGFPEVGFGILGEPPSLRRKRAFYAYQDFVSGAEVDDAEVVATTLPDFVLPDIPFTATVRVRNTGTTTWSYTAGAHLEVAIDRAGWEVEGLELDPTRLVPPSATVDFTLTLTPPGRQEPLPPHTWRFTWRVGREGRGAFGDPLSATVTVARDAPAEITRDPQSVVVLPGSSATFEVAASSETEPSYQWQRNGVDLVEGPRFVGTSTPTLEVRTIAPDLAGLYRCLVVNAAGARASAPARLVLVEQPDDPPRSATSGRVGP